eukprot:60323-Prymnesium_polylepis.1
MTSVWGGGTRQHVYACGDVDLCAAGCCVMAQRCVPVTRAQDAQTIGHVTIGVRRRRHRMRCCGGGVLGLVAVWARTSSAC